METTFEVEGSQIGCDETQRRGAAEKEMADLGLLGLFAPKEYKTSRLGLQSKIVLTTSLALLIVGAGLIFFFESNNAMAGMPLNERLLSSAFQSATSRTAG